MKWIILTSLLTLGALFSQGPSMNNFPMAGPPPNRFWGVGSNLESDSIASQASGLGVGWVRLAIFWNQVEIAKGVFDWRVPDVEIERAVLHHLNVFVTITGTPSWANGHQPDNVPPRARQDWVDFVRTVVSRYKSKQVVRAYGMWNEPNLKKFWTGSRSEYVNKILVPGAHAVKELKPSLWTCGPEMSHHWVNQKDWKLADILASGAEIDVITQHVYPEVSINPNGFAIFLDTKIKPVRGNRPVWVTECGMSVCKPFSELLQSVYTVYMMRAQSERSDWFTKIFPYRLWDPVNSCDNGNGNGLTFGEPIHQRQAYTAYRDFIRAHTK